MKNLKKLVVWSFVALLLATSAPGILSLMTGRASAAVAPQAPTNNAPGANADIDTQLQAYMYVRAVAACINDSPLTDGRDAQNAIDSDNASSYKWFSDAIAHHRTTYPGFIEGDDGKQSCGESDLISSAYSILQLGGTSDAITNLCYSGFKRNGTPNGSSASDCINGDPSKSIHRDGKGPDAVKQFLGNVNKQYYGTGGSDLPHMTPAMSYLFGVKSLTALCKAKVYSIGNPSSSTVNKSKQLVSITDVDGKTKVVYHLGRDKTDNVSVGVGNNLEEYKQSCESLAAMANATNAQAYAAANPDVDSIKDADDGSDTEEVNASCGGQNLVLKIINPLDWLSCAAVEGIQAAAEGLDSGIVSMLCINEGDVFGKDAAGGQACGAADTNSDSADSYKKAWNAFRLLSLGIIVIAGLVMVISQGLGYEIFDAYTVRKTLPRILFAGILITLSWQLMAFAVGLSNGLGIGMRQLIYTPFGGDDLQVVLSGGGNAIATLVGAGAFVSLGALGLLSFVGTAFLAILVAFVMLILRYILVVLLIIISPLAIAMYCLPNTEKFFKTWWDWLMKALLVFPLITSLIAIGHVIAALTSQKAADDGGAGGTITSFVAFGAYIIPYFVIPFAFRFAGGAIGTIGGFVNDRSKGGFDRLRNFRSGQREKNWNAIKNGTRWQGNRVGERASRALQTGSIVATGGAGVNPLQMRSRTQATRSALESAHVAEADKNPFVRAVMGNDDLLNAGLHGRGNDDSTRAYLQSLGQNGRELEQNVASVRAARRSLGREAFEEMAVVNLPGTGTGYRGGPSEMLQAINDVAGDDRAKAGRMLAQARGQAERAKRIDLYGAGMATSADQMAQLHAGRTNAASVNEIMTDEALLTKSAHEVGTARNNALGNMNGAITRRLARAQVDVETARISGSVVDAQRAEHEYKRVLASTAGLLDTAGSTSSENAAVVGGILGQNITLSGVTVRNRNGPATVSSAETLGGQIEHFRGDVEFQQYRREYGSSMPPGAIASSAGGTPPAAGPGGAAPPPPAPSGP